MAENERKRVPGAKRRTTQPPSRKHAPDVVYTPAKAFDRKKLLLHILTIAAVSFAVFLGLSIFFKVDTIAVSGCQKYNEWTVREASGIDEGDSLLFFGEAAAASRVIDALPYVTAVRFEVQLPGRVTIIVEEAPVVYSSQDASGYWWLITSEGRVAERVDSAEAGRHTEIKGFCLQNPVVGQYAVAMEREAEGASVKSKDRLEAALLMVQMLEKNELLGVVSSVDVSNLQALELWYGNRFQVKLGNSEKMEYKLAALRSTVRELTDHQTGILDISFTTFPDSVGYIPFPE